MVNTLLVQKKRTLIRVFRLNFSIKSAVKKILVKTSDEKDKTQKSLLILILQLFSRFFLSLVGIK